MLTLASCSIGRDSFERDTGRQLHAESCFCEAIRSEGIKQPANACRRLRSSWSRRWCSCVVTQTVGCQAGVPAPLCVHTRRGWTWQRVFPRDLSFRGQFADVLGMYLIATFALLYSIGQLRSLSSALFLGAYLAANAVLAMLLYWVPVYRRPIFGLLIVAVLLVELLIRRRHGPRSGASNLWTAAAIMGVAFVIWILDFTRTLCSPYSWMQGHAAWHVLGAAASWYLFRYYSWSDLAKPAKAR